MLGVGSPLHRGCPPCSPPPSFPPPRLHALSHLCTPHPLCAGRWVHKGVSAPTISTPPLFTHPFAQTAPLALPPPLRPPLVARTPFPRPHPLRANEDAKGVVCTLLPLVRSPAPPHLAPPCLTFHTLHFARMPGAQEGQCATSPPFRLWAAVPSTWAAPRPACTPSTPFAHTLGAGQTERPPSLSVHEQAPPPRLLPLPRLMPHLPRPPPPFARMRWEGQEGQCASPPSIRPSTQASPPPPAHLSLCPHAREAQETVPPSLPCAGSPLHLGSTCPL